MQLRSLKMTPQVFLQKSTTDVLNGKKGQFEQTVLRDNFPPTVVPMEY
jgi:hypothetical protein